MGDASEVVVRSWAEGPLPADVSVAIDRLARSDDVRRIAIMPDIHLSADVCIGTVVATRRTLYPNAVGGDIGCGLAALAFDCEASVLDNERAAAGVLAGLARAIPLTRQGRKGARALPAGLESLSLSAPSLEALKSREGHLQLGTLGRGNHFIELQSDEMGRLWLMLHSGSRGLGQAIRDHHLAKCATGRSGLRLLDADGPEGMAYLCDMRWAVAFADGNRLAMVAAVREVVGRVLGAVADEATYVACDHNHVRREVHAGEALWVHRKGAMSAASGEQGMVPGSMGTRSFHVEGRGCAEALSSSAHGAGRLMSRTEARRKLSGRDVARQLRGVWFDQRLSAALREEAPSAYKDVDAV